MQKTIYKSDKQSAFLILFFVPRYKKSAFFAKSRTTSNLIFNNNALDWNGRPYFRINKHFCNISIDTIRLFRYTRNVIFAIPKNIAICYRERQFLKRKKEKR